MGTTMSYIQLKNRGFTREELQRGLRALGRLAEEKPMDFEQQVRQLRGGTLSAQEQDILRFLSGVMMKARQEKPLQAGFRADAAWLPLWETGMCDGNILCSKDLGRLSEIFGTPALAFALFDSDVLFVSYRDDATGAAYDYARLPPWEGYEEYDKEVYQLGFPEFLADLCPPERREELRQIWEEDNEDEVFADDRMWKLLALLGMEAIDPGAEHFPEGFEIVNPE